MSQIEKGGLRLGPHVAGWIVRAAKGCVDDSSDTSRIAAEMTSAHAFLIVDLDHLVHNDNADYTHSIHRDSYRLTPHLIRARHQEA